MADGNVQLLLKTVLSLSQKVKSCHMTQQFQYIQHPTLDVYLRELQTLAVACGEGGNRVTANGCGVFLGGC